MEGSKGGRRWRAGGRKRDEGRNGERRREQRM